MLFPKANPPAVKAEITTDEPWIHGHKPGACLSATRLGGSWVLCVAIDGRCFDACGPDFDSVARELRRKVDAAKGEA